MDAVSGWVSATTAATMLQVGPEQVGWLARNGHLGTWVFRGQQRWFLCSEVEALVAERGRWVSYVQAARIIGCSTTTVTKLVHEGLLEQRGAGTTALASLGRESVERLAEERVQAAAELEARRRVRAPSAPPADHHDWISPAKAAKVLGTTDKGVHWLIAHERVPAERRGARWWLRRDLVQLVDLLVPRVAPELRSRCDHTRRLRCPAMGFRRTVLAAVCISSCAALSGCASEGDGDESSRDAASGVLTKAYEKCSQGEPVDWSAYGSQAPPVSDVVNLADSGNTIIVSTPFSEGESLGNLGYYIALCVLEETGAPDSVGAKLEQANLASVKTQNSETYGAITFEWYDYEVPDGTEFDATFESR